MTSSPPRRLVLAGVVLALAALASLAVLFGGGGAPGDATAGSVRAPGTVEAVATDLENARDGAARTAIAPAAPEAPAAPAPATLEVTVVRASDQSPVHGATISAADVTATTDEHGRATLTLIPERLLVSVSSPAAGLLDERGFVALAAGATKTLTVALGATAEVPFCGRLVSAADGSPIAGARLTLHHGVGESLASGPDGTFAVVANRERGFVAVDAPGSAPLRVAVVPGHESLEQALLVPVDAAAALDAALVDSRELGVAGAKVALRAFANDLTRPLGHYRGDLLWEASATTDATGRARFDALPANVPLAVEIERDGRRVLERVQVVLAPGPNERAWRVARSGSVRGRVVLADGRGVEGVPVDALPAGDAAGTPVALPWWELPRDRKSVRTDGEGRFELTGLPAGPWLVGVTRDESGPAGARGFRCAPVCTRIEVQSDATTECELTTSDDLAIAGRALLPDGAPAKGQIVIARRVGPDGRGQEFSTSARVEADGRFRCAPLLPGDYEVSIDIEFETAFGTLRPVRARAGSDGVELRLVPVCGDVAGTVVAADSGAPARAWVAARAIEGPGAIAGHCDLDGGFRFQGLRAGQWTVRARDDRGRAALTLPITIEPGREHGGVVLALAPGAQLVLRHPPAQGEVSFEVCRDGVVIYDDPLADAGAPGVVRLTVVPGRLEVRFLVAGATTSTTAVELRAGEERLVEPTR